MSGMGEKVFPRGGRNPTLSNKPVKTTSFSLFNKGGRKVKKKVKEKGEKKKRQHKTATTSKEEDVILKPAKELKVKYVDDLKSNMLHEGMLILGIVSRVTDKLIDVSLPGGLRGIVTLKNVSQFYRDLIMNARQNSDIAGLRDLFSVGEIFPTKVISVSEDSRKKFLITLDPKMINSKITEIEKGMILVGSVKSEEDHGYIIDFGIKAIHGFLNFEKIDKGIKLPIGKLVRCVITKSTNVLGVANVELSLLQEDLRNGWLSSDSCCPIHSFIPGFQFKLRVTRVFKNGVEISYREDKNQKGFIYEDHLLQLFPQLSKIEIGTEYKGTLLYVKPLANLPYFKIISDRPQKWIYPIGKIIKGKVVKSIRSGVTFRFGRKPFLTKCFVPLSQLSDSNKLIDHDLEVDTLYPAGKVVDKIRLKKIDYMSRYYVGATDKSNVDEKYFSLSDLKCGDIVPCKIEAIQETVARIRIGKILGVVSLSDLTDIPLRNPSSKFKVGQIVQGRVAKINNLTQSVRVTMKPTLMKKKLKTLMEYSEAKINECYTGTVIKVSQKELIVRFFNEVVGKIPKKFTPYSEEPSLEAHYTSGQLVKCYVVSVRGTNLLLSVMRLKSCNLKIGEKYEVIVTSIETFGLRVRVMAHGKNEPITGMIPCELLCSYPGLGEALLPTYSIKQKLTAYYVYEEFSSLPIFAVCDIIARFYEILGAENVQSNALVGINYVYPFLYNYVNRKSGDLKLCPVIPCKKYKFYVQRDSVSDDNLDGDLNLRKYQVLYGIIKDIRGKQVYVSVKLSDVWDRSCRMSLELLDSYLDGMKRIIQYHRETNEDYVKNIKLGSNVSINVTNKGVIHEINKATLATGKKDAVTGTVVWIRGDKKLLCVNTTSTAHIKEQVPDEEFELLNTTYRAEVVYIGDDVFVTSLKGKGNGQLVCLPRKRHLNDFFNSKCPYLVGRETRVWLERGRTGNLLGIDRQVKLLDEKKIWISYENKLRERMKSIKRKIPMEEHNGKMMRLENGDEMEIISEKLSGKMEVKEEKEKDSDDDIQCDFVGVPNGSIPVKEIKQELESEDCMDVSVMSGILDTSVRSDSFDASQVEIKSEDESLEEKDKEKESDLYRKERILLSSSSESESEDEVIAKRSNETNLNIGFDWNVLNNRKLLSGVVSKPEDISSSSDDEEETKNAKKKRVRLTKSEREAKAREEEDRLRLIEERLIRSDLEPETADDFDRALLAKPNSSALWVKYMAFHLQATEIEKARNVARRALKTIAFNEEQEKLNVWVALLNLENLYGNEESLNKILGEALMYNEPYHVHLHMMNMHGQSGKFQDMERVGNMLMKKFKDVEKMWESVGLAYFKVGKVELARHVLQRALPLLPKKKHVELISQFAQMENKYGSSERAQTLYETILGSLPKRVDVWSCYVDMLVKSNMIDLARQVLERATSQSLPPKKMKTLFKKFIAFEEEHGTSENIEKVRQSAVDYVESVGTATEK